LAAADILARVSGVCVLPLLAAADLATASGDIVFPLLIADNLARRSGDCCHRAFRDADILARVSGL
jgi:hypothetical protein